MTVCVATLAVNGAILGAADRMLTSRDVEFEPPASKITELTNSIVVMFAGDASLHAELMNDLQLWAGRHISMNPREWILVKHAVEEYCRLHSDIRRLAAEIIYLRPLGLTTESFLSQQRQLSPELVKDLAREILAFQLPAIAAIIVGVDPTGSHLYVVEDGRPRCEDAVGFCAIGFGGSHAESQLMAAKFVPSTPEDEAVLLTYAAKKRAEVAPGVGVDTDMFIMGPALGSFTPIHSSFIEEIEKIHARWRQEERSAFERGKHEAREFIQRLVDIVGRKDQTVPEAAGGPAGDSPPAEAAGA